MKKIALHYRKSRVVLGSEKTIMAPENPYLSHAKADQASQAMLLDSMAEGVLVRQGSNVVFANRAIFDILGASFEDEEHVSRPMDDWIHPEDRGKVESSFQRRVAGGDADSEYEFRLIRLDGSMLWVSCRAAVVDWSGEKAVVAFLRDISDEIESRNNHKLSSDLFKNIFNVTPDFMLLFGLDTLTVLDVNPAFLNVFGYRKDSVIQTSVGQLEMWSDPTFFERFVHELKTTASITDIPAALRTRGGAIRHFRLFARRIDGTESPLLLMTGRDVTEEISHAQELQRTRDAAELSNRTKSEFLANMSHELRTPLNAILGFSEVIRDGVGGIDLSDKHGDYANDIHKSGTHLLAIINNILDLSKVEAGRLEAHLSVLDPVPCFDMCLRLIHHRASESGVRLTHKFEDNLLLEADERLLKQIGLNLLSNAVKFTEHGGSVDFSFQRSRDGGACIAVCDTGIGMTPDEITIAMRPFGQVDSSLSRIHQGSGLGLPLVVAFAEKLGARMTIESQPKQGTLVRVFFPAEIVQERTAPEPSEAIAS